MGLEGVSGQFEAIANLANEVASQGIRYPQGATCLWGLLWLQGGRWCCALGGFCTAERVWWGCRLTYVQCLQVPLVLGVLPP
jgi:hypothetical protein